MNAINRIPAIPNAVRRLWCGLPEPIAYAIITNPVKNKAMIPAAFTVILNIV